MKTGTIARIGAAGFVVTALALSLVQLNEPASTATQTVFVADDGIDPLRAELRRCRSIGQAAASDTLCLRAWAEQRSRFFMGVQQATGSDFGEGESAASATIDGGAAANSDAAAPSPSPMQDGSN
ncbi:MAG: putative entry exclusion protein TrbK-alt [Sphingomonadales bacterium]|nr:putative entry exclusion protein TrbK-alt [Sphingomonadales bacterium]